MTVPNIMEIISSDLRCPCCGHKMIAQVDKGRNVRAITLDRVHNDRGYVRGNVEIICWTCNVRKRDMTAADLRQLAEYVERHA